jgi:hypothetical protein
MTRYGIPYRTGGFRPSGPRRARLPGGVGHLALAAEINFNSATDDVDEVSRLAEIVF